MRRVAHAQLFYVQIFALTTATATARITVVREEHGDVEIAARHGPGWPR